MSHKFINDQVDIFEFPVPDDSYRGIAGIQVTIGDLHGNAMKLMFMLVKHGIATNINKSDYHRLVEIRSYALTTPENFGFKCSLP
jgi:hypothetical protein